MPEPRRTHAPCCRAVDRRVVEHAGLARARLALHEQQDGLAGERSRELILERAQLLVAPDEGRLRQRPASIVRADRHRRLADAALQPGRDLVEVGQDRGRGLVAIPRVLLEEVLDDVVERARHAAAPVQPRGLRREVLPQDVAHRRALERRPSREALEQDDRRPSRDPTARRSPQWMSPACSGET